MRPSVLISGATLALLLAAPLHAQGAVPLTDDQFLKLGKQYTQWFFHGDADSLLAHMAPETQAAVGGRDGILENRARVDERAGVELSVVEEKMTRRHGHPQFWHSGQFSSLEDPIVLRWVMDDAGRITGVGLGPRNQTPAPDTTATAAPSGS